MQPIAKSQLGNNLTDAEKIAKLRAIAIGKMIGFVAKIFIENEEKLLSGEFNNELIKLTPHSDDISRAKSFARERIYESQSKIKLELAGYEIISGLLANLVPVACELAERNWDTTQLCERSKKLQRLVVPGGLNNVRSMYEALLRITDLISGMTDRYALAMYRNLKGISLQS